MNPDNKFCSQCGNETEVEANFCDNCGHTFKQDVNVEQLNEKGPINSSPVINEKKQVSKKMMVIIGIASVVVILFLFNPFSASPIAGEYYDMNNDGIRVSITKDNNMIILWEEEDIYGSFVSLYLHYDKQTNRYVLDNSKPASTTYQLNPYFFVTEDYIEDELLYFEEMGYEIEKVNNNYLATYTFKDRKDFYDEFGTLVNLEIEAFGKDDLIVNIEGEKNILIKMR